MVRRPREVYQVVETLRSRAGKLALASSIAGAFAALSLGVGYNGTYAYSYLGLRSSLMLTSGYAISITASLLGGVTSYVGRASVSRNEYSTAFSFLVYSIIAFAISIASSTTSLLFLDPYLTEAGLVRNVDVLSIRSATLLGFAIVVASLAMSMGSLLLIKRLRSIYAPRVARRAR